MSSWTLISVLLSVHCWLVVLIGALIQHTGLVHLWDNWTVLNLELFREKDCLYKILRRSYGSCLTIELFLIMSIKGIVNPSTDRLVISIWHAEVVIGSDTKHLNRSKVAAGVHALMHCWYLWLCIIILLIVHFRLWWHAKMISWLLNWRRLSRPLWSSIHSITSHTLVQNTIFRSVVSFTLHELIIIILIALVLLPPAIVHVLFFMWHCLVHLVW